MQAVGGDAGPLQPSCQLVSEQHIHQLGLAVDAGGIIAVLILQIVEINLKDFKDTIVLLLEHPLSHRESGPKAIDTGYLVDIMRQDWGFYYTFTTNLKRVPDHFAEFPSLGEREHGVIRSRIDELLRAIEDAPKTFGWKMRAKVGTRRRWYQEVSEKSAQF